MDHGVAQLGLAEARDLFGVDEALREVLHRAEVEGDQQRPGDDDCQHDRLVGGQEHGEQGDDGDADNAHDDPAEDEGAVVLPQHPRPLLDATAELIPVRQGGHDVGRAVGRAHDLHLLVGDQVRARELAVEQEVGVRGGESEQPPQGEGRGGHGEKRRHEAEVVVAVEPGDGLAHRVDAVAEGEEGVDAAEEVGHELDGVEARRARDLDDDEEDGDAAANVAERGDDGVDDPRVGNPDGDCGDEKGRDGLYLHPKCHVAERHHDGLEHRERGEEEEAAEVGLADGEAAEALGVDLDAEDDR